MKALLVVDVQNGLVEKALFQKERFLTVVEEAIKIARLLNHLVIGIQHTNNQLVVGSTRWMIYPSMEIRDQDPIVLKHHGNAFEETDLQKILLEKEVKEVIICGLVSHGCVRATCLGALEEGFTVSLLKHGHSCWNKDASVKIATVEKELQEQVVLIRKALEVFKGVDLVMENSDFIMYRSEKTENLI